MKVLNRKLYQHSLALSTGLVKALCRVFFIFLSILALNTLAQEANNTKIQNEIIKALPSGITPAKANHDQITLAAQQVVFSMEGDLLLNVKQVMISLGELDQAKTFSHAITEQASLTDQFYQNIINMASLKYEGLTTLDITPLSKAMIEGINYLNDAESLQHEN